MQNPKLPVGRPGKASQEGLLRGLASTPCPIPSEDGSALFFHSYFYEELSLPSEGSYMNHSLGRTCFPASEILAHPQISFVISNPEHQDFYLLLLTPSHFSELQLSFKMEIAPFSDF